MTNKGGGYIEYRCTHTAPSSAFHYRPGWVQDLASSPAPPAPRLAPPTNPNLPCTTLPDMSPPPPPNSPLQEEGRPVSRQVHHPSEGVIGPQVGPAKGPEGEQHICVHVVLVHDGIDHNAVCCRTGRSGQGCVLCQNCSTESVMHCNVANLLDPSPRDVWGHGIPQGCKGSSHCPCTR